MNRDDYPNPEEYIFYCEKDDWYETDKEGERDWSKSKEQCAEFWEKVREEKMNAKDFDFSKFIFPTMRYSGNNFWKEEETREFLGGVNFSNSKFVGETSFRGSTFEGETSFSDSTFEGETYFWGSTFAGETSFWGSKFAGETDFWGSTFAGKTYFRHSTFAGKTSFRRSTFEGETSFWGSTFAGETSFRDSTFAGETDFSNSTFEKGTYFDNSQFSGEKILFQDCFRGEESEQEGIIFSFKNILFTDKVIFRRINLQRTSFHQSDLVDAQFKECDFGGGHRIILEGENNDETQNDYKALEGLYRQLKRNFERNKNWELSGKAFFSEMYMRRRRLRQEGKWGMWLLYTFYGVFGGYTQRPKNSIISIAGLIGLCSFLYLFIDCDPINALQRGVYGAFPRFLDIHLTDTATKSVYPDGWLIVKNLEFIFGSVFLAFFILSLRKQFKQ